MLGDLHHRADHHQLPLGAGVGHRSDQFEIDPLVDHAIKAEPRPSDPGLVGRVGEHGAGGAEMLAIDRRGKRMDVAVPLLLRFVERIAAGEDHIRSPEQFGLEI